MDIDGGGLASVMASHVAEDRKAQLRATYRTPWHITNAGAVSEGARMCARAGYACPDVTRMCTDYPVP